MGMQPNPELKSIDSAVLTPLIRLSLDRREAEVIDWKQDEMHGGSLISEIYRFSGNARDRGAVLPWSLILKIIRSPDDQGDPGSLRYWKREALVYQSGLLDKLPGMICAPRCYAVVERSGLEMWMWTEEVVDEIKGNMSLEQYGIAARHVGQFNGAWFDKQALLSQPWLGKGRLRDWTGSNAPEIPPEVRAHPLVMRYLSNDMYQWMQQVWSKHEAWIDRIEHQPQTLSHGDVFRRNLFTRRDQQGNPQTVLIDWAFAGSAAAGEEIAPLVAGSLNFLDVNAQPAALDQIVFEGYIEGLHDAGWRGDPREVRFTYAASSILKYTVGVYGVAFMVADENQRPLLEQIFGHPLEELVDAWAATTRFLRHLADEVHSL
jgi:hypothetical protein